jgi:SAM-dependent methyltransferase
VLGSESFILSAVLKLGNYGSVLGGVLDTCKAPGLRPVAGVCVVCGADRLAAHLRVAGGIGAEGLVPSTERFGTALGDIVCCRSCGHMQLDPLPSAELLAEGYAEAESEDYIEEEAGQRATARRALDAIEPHLAPGRLLDLGCWVGYLLSEAHRRGWQGVGVEPSRFASAYARERLGLDVRTEALLSARLDPGSFDAIVMADVIEHLLDPGAALRHCAQLARPGGILYLALPDAGSAVARMLGRRWWSVIPTHVQYFTRPSLTMLLERNGWRVLAVTSAPKMFTVRYYLSRVRGYSPRLAEGLIAAAARAGLAGRLVTPDFRDRMAIIARLD